MSDYGEPYGTNGRRICNSKKNEMAINTNETIIWNFLSIRLIIKSIAHGVPMSIPQGFQNITVIPDTTILKTLLKAHALAN